MPSAVISLVFGLLSFTSSIPILLPVIGLGLGVNSYLKENKKIKKAQDKSIKIISMIGTGLCSLVVLLFFVGRLIGV